MRKSLLALTIALCAASASAQSVRDGIDAWQKGDAAKAVAIWKPLAEKGDADAAFNLGQAYRLGRGVSTDLAQATRWLEVAARKGHLDAQATLGLLQFQNGNRVGAMRWLVAAADKGEPRALLMVGTAMFNGDGIKQDQVRAYAYVSRAAAMGLGPAQATLADMDAVLPLDQRKQGVELAKVMVRGGTKVASPAPKATTAAPKVYPMPKATATAKPVTPPAPSPAAAPAIAASGSWRIQLGAFSQRGSAESLFARLEPKLAGRQAYFVPVGKVIRLQAGPFESRAAASAACSRVAPTPCFPVNGR